MGLEADAGLSTFLWVIMYVVSLRVRPICHDCYATLESVVSIKFHSYVFLKVSAVVAVNLVKEDDTLSRLSA